MLFNAQMIWSAGVALLWVGSLFFSPVDPDYTSGELLDHFYSWRQGAELYPPLGSSPFRVLNYPPLYFYLVRGVALLGVTPLLAGRIVNLAAFFAAAWVLLCWLRKERDDKARGWHVLGLVGASFPILYSLGQMHLQLTAVALSLGGLYLLQFGKKPMTICASACLLATAIFVKQTQWVSACIAICWLVAHRKTLCLPFLLSFLITATGGGLLLQSLHGEEIWRHLLTYTVGTYSFANFFQSSVQYLLSWSFFFILGFYFFFKFGQKRSRLSCWYFLGSSLWLVSSARDGASFQYFLEWSFALLIWIGPLLTTERQEQSPKPPRKRRLAARFLILQVVLADLGVAGVLIYNISQLKQTTSKLSQICHQLGPAQNPVPGEFPGIVRTCGHTPALHPFIMASLARQGIWNEKPFLDQIEDGTYPVLLLTPDWNKESGNPFDRRWTSQMVDGITTHYKEAASFGQWHIWKHRKVSNCSPKFQWNLLKRISQRLILFPR